MDKRNQFDSIQMANKKICFQQEIFMIRMKMIWILNLCAAGSIPVTFFFFRCLFMFMINKTHFPSFDHCKYASKFKPPANLQTCKLLTCIIVLLLQIVKQSLQERICNLEFEDNGSTLRCWFYSFQVKLLNGIHIHLGPYYSHKMWIHCCCNSLAYH